eukprot:Sdes_comp20947_c2_seq4m18568
MLASCSLILAGNWINAILLFASHILVVWTVYPAVYSEIPSSHPYITGLSVVMGVYAFDWQGAVFGPILICIPGIVYELYMDYLHENPMTKGKSPQSGILRPPSTSEERGTHQGENETFRAARSTSPSVAFLEQ